MKRTLLSLFALTILTVFTLSIASAALSLEIVGSSTLSNTQNTSLKLTNTGIGNVTGITFEVSGVQVSPSTIASLPSNNSTFINVTKFLTDTRFGSQTSTIRAKGTDNSTVIESNVASLTAENTFCKNGPQRDNLTIDTVNINNNGEGDDTEWKPLDTITVEVRIRNQGDSDVSDVDVKLGLFDSEGRNKIGDLDFTNTDEETINLGRINNGDRETATFEFKVPADVTTGDYKLAVKAYSNKVGESNLCVDSSSDLSNDIFESIDITPESDEGKFIAFDNVVVNPEQATCGDTVDVNFDVANVGDQDQDQVQVTMVNRELGIDLSREIRNNLDQGDRQSLSFTFSVPSAATDKTYNLELRSNYDYRNGVYRQHSDEGTLVPIKVFGCSVSGGTGSGSGNSNVAISASLESDAKAGSPMTVKVSVTNRGTSSAQQIINVKGYESWATLDSISDRVVSLAPGESKDITLKFNVDKSASGDKTFTVDSQSGTSVQSKDVVVTIAGSSGFSLGTLAGNPLVWIIGIINVVLIVLIIVVAVRLSQRS
ncbi:putative S-layer protein [Candidatus Pacearchaeota archaeon]|nr:putative S-layer protein [Candidatus Pacearchaeota archaeon]